MKSTFLLLLTICSLFTNEVRSQSFFADEHLKQLKNGVLLVKLYSRTPTIEALKERGLEERAENVDREQKFKNMAIVKSFERNYNFSPKVYFFYSEDSQDILQENFEGKLMGYDLQTLNNVDVGNNFYIAEFGNTENVGMNALIFKDKQNNQLKKPFPYFTRTFEGLLFLERSFDKVVEMQNQKLHEAYLLYY